MEKLFNKTDYELEIEHELMDKLILDELNGVPVGVNNIELLRWDKAEDGLIEEIEDIEQFLRGSMYE